MNIRIEYGIIKKFLLLFFIFVFSALNVQAQNALSSVSVSQTAGNSYNITLKTDGSVRIKKYADSIQTQFPIGNAVSEFCSFGTVRVGYKRHRLHAYFGTGAHLRNAL